MEFEKDVEVKGIPAYRFTPPRSVLASKEENPANEGFCITPQECLGTGLLKVSPCRKGKRHYFLTHTALCSALHPRLTVHALPVLMSSSLIGSDFCVCFCAVPPCFLHKVLSVRLSVTFLPTVTSSSKCTMWFSSPALSTSQAPADHDWPSSWEAVSPVTWFWPSIWTQISLVPCSTAKFRLFLPTFACSNASILTIFFYTTATAIMSHQCLQDAFHSEWTKAKGLCLHNC